MMGRDELGKDCIINYRITGLLEVHGWAGERIASTRLLLYSASNPRSTPASNSAETSSGLEMHLLKARSGGVLPIKKLEGSL
jgi:hypothetical protein